MPGASTWVQQSPVGFSNTLSSPPPYQTSPELPLLINQVASIIPDLWRAVGTQLGVPAHFLESFWRQRGGNSMDCFGDVFVYWKEKCTMPYTWLTIIQVLEMPAVGQLELAQTLRSIHLC